MNFKKYHVSRNLWDEDYTGISATAIYKPIYVGNENVTLSIDYPLYQSTGVIFILAGDVSSGISTDTNGVWLGHPKTVTPIDGYVTIAFRGYQTTSPVGYHAMLNSGSTPLPYEPYSSEVWHDIPHYIMGTSTDAITTPAVIYANGTTATIGLKGDMYQASGVSPTTPIQPQECGERTGNLAYKIIENANISPEGLIATTSGYNIMVAKVAQGQAYSGTGYVYAFFNDEPDIRSTSYNESRVVNNFKNVTAPISGYVAVRYAPSENPMLNSGSTPLPYEPYGYKIPISSASTTTNIYLGEVESTRQIKKLVLTGNEIWGRVNNCFRLSLPNSSNTVGTIISTHFEYKIPWALINTASVGACVSTTYYGTAYKYLMIRCDDIATTAADFKSYLADQYANGTPVTVWYVLAEPQTAIVNEPLMKIGDYADEVSGISIPTTAGANTLSVDTTLQPSEVSVNYKGWHPITNVHEHNNGAWN